MSSDLGLMESRCHLFLECPFPDGIWSSVLFKRDGSWVSHPWPLFVMWTANRWKEKSLSSIVFKLCLAATVYHVWRKQNNHRFNKLCQLAMVVLNSIKSTIRLWLSSLKIAHTTANESTLWE